MQLHVAENRVASTPVLDRCERCVFLKACGGRSAFSGLFNCFDDFPWREGSDDVCPSNPAFAERVAEVHGLSFDGLALLEQQLAELPQYVPHLSHRYCRLFPLQWPVIAVTTYELFRREGGDAYRAVAKDGQSLRAYFNLAPDTRLVLRGTEHDRPLERYWSHRRTSHAPKQLAALGVDLVIGPNFSQFVDVPRTDNLFNRKRQLLCLEEFAQAGLKVVPHLSAAVDSDWLFWQDYLRERREIRIVAKELQTGTRRRGQALRCLQQMELIQQRLGRPLHPILIGGAHVTEFAASMFENFTVLDSRPFQSAVHRRSFQPKGRRARWVSDFTLPGFKIDGLLHQNFEDYSRWIALRAKVKAGLRFLGNRRTG